MENDPRNVIKRLLALVALTLTLGACATAPPRPEAAGEASRLYGVAGDRLLRLDPANGAVTAVASSPELAGAGALAYDPGLDVFYAIAAATSEPRLVFIERASGEVTAIGPIDLSAVDLMIAEGLAFDAAGGRLIAAGGWSHFQSDRLLAVDPTTGGAIEIARVRGTLQDDVDALVLAGKTLYAVDAAANTSTLYRLDPESGEATATGTTFHGSVAGLAYDAEAGLLVAAVAGSGRLVALPPSGGEPSTLGAIDAAKLGGAELTALAFVNPAVGPLSDDFESGDLSTWSGHEPGGGR